MFFGSVLLLLLLKVACDDVCATPETCPDPIVREYLMQQQQKMASPKPTTTSPEKSNDSQQNPKLKRTPDHVMTREKVKSKVGTIRRMVGECDGPDEEDRCGTWASMGECEHNSGYMMQFCCQSCKKVLLRSSETRVLTELERNGGLEQEVSGSAEEQEKMAAVLAEMWEHMESLDFELVDNCKNTNKLCVFWAAIGECEANRSWMITGCAPACRSCDKLLYENRCPFDESIEPIYKPGEMNDMFSSLVRDYDDAYGPISVLSDDPWVVTFDNFLTDEECDRLIEHGERLNFERSTDVGKKNFDGTMEKVVSQGRTSSNAWCKGNCNNDTVVEEIMRRINTVTRTELNNTEQLQILKYEPGEFYKVHHDYIPNHKDRNCGPRVLTFFLYLNDVEEGGATGFPTLKPPLRVFPKKGKALLWPSTLNGDPFLKDSRTMHEAEPVVRGKKFAANSWIHLKDFRAAHEKGCAG